MKASRTIRTWRVLRVAGGLLLAVSTGARGQGLDTVSMAPTERLDALDAEVGAVHAAVQGAAVEKARLEAEIGALGEQRITTNGRLRSHVRSLYRVAHAGALPITGGLEALLAHLARVERLERMVGREAQDLRTLDGRVAALGDEVRRVGLRLEEARAREVALVGQRGGVADAARRFEEQAAAMSEWPAGAQASTPGTPAAAPAPAGFALAQGHLEVPVVGPTLLRAGSREDGAGLELGGAPGTAVRAAADGRVAFSDHHPVYGRLVILDHGAGYFTVYGGLGRASAAVGAELDRGATLGVLGMGPVFFQVRRGTRALDARSWLGL